MLLRLGVSEADGVLDALGILLWLSVAACDGEPVALGVGIDDAVDDCVKVGVADCDWLGVLVEEGVIALERLEVSLAVAL